MKRGSKFAAICSCHELVVNEDKCPYCGAPIYNKTNYDITWDESKKQYSVSIVYPFDLFVPSDDQLLRSLPRLIADMSSCSCGKKLNLSNHKIKKHDGNIIIEAIFICQRCNSGFRTILRKLISKFGRDTKKIQIGKDGISYEKNSSS